MIVIPLRLLEALPLPEAITKGLPFFLLSDFFRTDFGKKQCAKRLRQQD